MAVDGFGNEITQAGQAAQSALEGGDLESRVAALEGQAGAAGGGEVPGVAGMNAGAIANAGNMFGSISDRQSSVGRGISSAFSGLFR
jgi:hypothetical protein